MVTTKETPIAAAGLSDVGRVREQNEDSFLVRLIKEKHRVPFGIRAVLLVADGMGGHIGGREASTAAVSLVADLFSPRHTDAQAHLGDDIHSFIRGVIREADDRVRQIGRGEDKAPGTTFTGAFIVDSRAFIGHIGDSRAYQIRNDEIVCLTDDHSYVAHLVREGKLSPEEAEHSPQKNVLMRSLGTEGGVTVDDPREAYLMDGDILVLCTDGLWDLVSKKEIVSIVQGHKDLSAACARLIRLANARGGHDNITVAAARFGRFKKGRTAPMPPDVRGHAAVPGRIGRMILRAAAYGGVIVLSALFCLIILFILNELSIVTAPWPVEPLKRLITP